MTSPLQSEHLVARAVLFAVCLHVQVPSQPPLQRHALSAPAFCAARVHWLFYTGTCYAQLMPHKAALWLKVSPLQGLWPPGGAAKGALRDAGAGGAGGGDDAAAAPHAARHRRHPRPLDPGMALLLSLSRDLSC